jgi:hypothetical protein
MSKPVSYEDFCKRHELDPKAKESKKEYQEYKDKLGFFNTLK